MAPKQLRLALSRPAFRGRQAQAWRSGVYGKKCQEIGKLVVSGQGVPEMELPRIAGADVERLGLFARIPVVIGRWFGG